MAELCSVPPSTPERQSPEPPLADAKETAPPAAAPGDAPPKEKPSFSAEDFFPEAFLPPRAAVSADLSFLLELQRFKFLQRIALKERTETLYLLLRVLLSFAELAAAFAQESETPIDARSVRQQLVSELSDAKTLARLVLLVDKYRPSRATLIAAPGPEAVALLVSPLLNALSTLSFVPVTAGFFAALNRRPDMRVSGAIFFSTDELDGDRELRARTARAWNAFVHPDDWALVSVAPGTANKRAKWVPRPDAPDAF